MHKCNFCHYTNQRSNNTLQHMKRWHSFENTKESHPGVDCSDSIRLIQTRDKYYPWCFTCHNIKKDTKVSFTPCVIDSNEFMNHKIINAKIHTCCSVKPRGIIKNRKIKTDSSSSSSSSSSSVTATSSVTETPSKLRSMLEQLIDYNNDPVLYPLEEGETESSEDLDKTIFDLISKLIKQEKLSVTYMEKLQEMINKLEGEITVLKEENSEVKEKLAEFTE